MKNVIAMAIAAISFNAAALTFESGQVLTTGADGKQTVANIEDTAYGKSQLEKNGYVITGRTLVIDAGGTAVSIPTHELAGKSKDQIKETIGDAIRDEFAANALVEDVDAAYADYQTALNDEVEKLASEGIEAFNASDFTVDELVEQVTNSTATTGAIVGITEEINDKIVDAFIEEAEAGGTAFFDPKTGICHGCE